VASKEVFARGMAALALNFNRDMTDELFVLYWAVLQDVPDEDLDRAFRRVLQEDEFFPPTGRLARYAHQHRPPTADAAAVFERILGDYASGEHLIPRAVEERYGVAARYGFLAAGGIVAFERIGGDGMERAREFALKEFARAWAETTQADPRAALPGPANQLPEGAVLDRVRDIVKRMP
jgi:hypothetical protein